MVVIETWFNQDLQKPVQVNYLDGNLFSNNGNGNRIGVVVTNNGEAVTLTGTVSGYAVLADGTTVPCTGTRSGNKASILVPPAAYIPGAIFVSVFLTDGNTVTTLAAVSSSVLRARTDNQVDPGSVVTDWTQTINAAMQDVVDAAEGLEDIVATPYEELTFPVPLGAYTIYNHNLYRCTTPIATSESFTAAHWSAKTNLGQELSDLNRAFDYYETFISVYNATSGYVISLSADIGETVDPTPTSSSSYGYQILSVEKGESIKITGTSELSGGRLWGFTDSSYKLLSKAPRNTSVSDGFLLAPADGYLICNFKWSATKGLKKGILKVETDIEEIQQDISSDETRLNNLQNESEHFKVYGSILSVTSGGAIINTAGSIGSVVSTTPVENSSHRYQIQSVKKGESFLLTASSTSPNGRIWAFTDSEYKLISHADSLADVTELLLYAPADGYLICNFKWSATHALSKGYLNDENSPLVGKKVAWYGDSIIQNGWWGTVSKHFAMQSTNCGVYGTKISGTDSDCMCQISRINGTYEEGGKKIPDDAEYIIIGAGTNDWAQNVPLGDKAIQYNSSWEIVEDVTTFYQACHVMFRRLAEQRPNAKLIVLGTPFGKMINRAGFTNKYGLINSQGLTSLDYGDALCDVAEMWGYYAIRYGKKIGINDSNVATLLDPTSESGSHLHPTTDAAKKMFADAALSGLSYLCSQ